MKPLSRRRWLAAVAGAAAATHSQAAEPPLRVRGPWIDDQGRPFALESLQGRQAVITLAYGACRRVCSTSLRMLKEIQVEADRQARPLLFVVIGLDPANDTPQDWAQWRADNGLVRPNWFLLTGSVAATRRMAQALNTRLWHYGDHVVHDLRIVLLSAEGRELRVVDRFDQGPGVLLG